jgi:signal transduction histidine kinase
MTGRPPRPTVRSVTAVRHHAPASPTRIPAFAVPERVRLVGVSLFVAVVQVGVTLVASGHQTDVRSLDVLGICLLLAGPAALLARWRRPLATYVIVFAITTTYWLLDYPDGPVPLSLLIAFVNLAMTGQRAVAWTGLALGYVTAAWIAPRIDDGPWPNWGLAAGLGAWLALVAVVTELARSWMERSAERAQALEDEARRRASEERLRIARELHDVLAHNISLINVRAGVALHLIDERAAAAAASAGTDVVGATGPGSGGAGANAVAGASGGDAGSAGAAGSDAGASAAAPAGAPAGTTVEIDVDQVRPALAAIKDASKEALGELRSVLDVLRQGEAAPLAPTAGLADLDTLVERARGTGLDVRLEGPGAVDGLPAGVDLAAFRIVQEALTNVVRHAQATRVTVRVQGGDGELEVQVDDDGQGGLAPPGHTGGGRRGGERTDRAGRGGSEGRGIAGMRERALALGGSLEAGPRPGRGFRVRARLPLSGATSGPSPGAGGAGASGATSGPSPGAGGAGASGATSGPSPGVGGAGTSGATSGPSPGAGGAGTSGTTGSGGDTSERAGDGA